MSNHPPASGNGRTDDLKLYADACYDRSVGKLTSEMKEKLDKRRDIFDVIEHIPLPREDVRFMNHKWAERVAELDENEVDKYRRILPWLTRVSYACRDYPLIDRKLRALNLPTVPYMMQHALETGVIPSFKKTLEKCDLVLYGMDLEAPSLNSLPSVVEYRAKSASLASRIVKDYEELQSLWQASNDTVQAKWMRMSEARRVEMLTQCGVTNRGHRTDFLSLIHHGPPSEDWSSEFGHMDTQPLNIENWRVPHINTEDLKNGNLLLTFLESRATVSPHLFSWMDRNMVEVAYSLNISGILPPELYQHAIDFGSSIDVDTYGKIFTQMEALVACAANAGCRLDAITEKIQSEHWFGVSARSGLATMEVQAYTYNFLKKVFVGIRDAQDEGPQNLATAESTIRAEPSEEHVGGTVDPIIKAFKERHYIKPGQAEIVSLMNLISTLKRNQRDEILMLRENPGFFADSLRQYRDHSKDYISWHGAGKRSTVQSSTKSTKSDEFNTEVMKDMIFDSFRAFLALEDLEKEFDMVQRLFVASRRNGEIENFKGNLGDRTPKIFAQACGRLLRKLLYYITIEIEDFRTFFAASPHFRGRFLRYKLAAKDQDGNDNGIKLNTVKPGQMKEYGDLVMLIGRLVDQQDPFMMNLVPVDSVLLVDELHRLVAAESAKDDSITPFLNKRISLMVVYAACLAQLFQYQPAGRLFLLQMRVWSKDKAFEAEDKVVVSRKGIKEKIYKASVKGFVGPFVEGNYVRLFDNPPTRKSTPRRRKAEGGLAGLWQGIRRNLEELEEKLPESVKKILHEETSMTPPWKVEGKEAELDGSEAPKVLEEQPAQKVAEKEPVKEPALKRPEFKLVPVSGHGTLKRPADEAELDEEETSEPTGPPRKKVKTRGEADPEKAAQEAETQARAEARKAPAEGTPAGMRVPDEFEVDQRDLNTFQTLFFQQGVTSHAGEWPWTDICRAMTHLGFAMAPMGGSMVRFTPPAEWQAEEITFHSPHPQRNVSFFKCRVIGRRLSRNYGMEANHFVLKNA